VRALFAISFSFAPICFGFALGGKPSNSTGVSIVNIKYLKDDKDLEGIISLQGEVRMGGSNKIVPNAEIEIRDTNNKLIAKKTADSKGRFKFTIKTEPTVGNININGSDGNSLGELEIAKVDMGRFYSQIEIAVKLFIIKGVMKSTVPLSKKEIKEIKNQNNK